MKNFLYRVCLWISFVGMWIPLVNFLSKIFFSIYFNKNSVVMNFLLKYGYDE